jgi:uncharacterized damage-inducible protein DinB
MNRLELIGIACALGACLASAQNNPLSKDAKDRYMEVKGDVLKSAAKVPEELYSFKPSPDVRGFGQLLAHIADAQYEFCGPVKGEMKSDIEKTKTSKADITKALNDAFAYCDPLYNNMTDAMASQMIKFDGQRTKLVTLDYNTMHSFEHYGNLVTYMRIKGIVPPSSEQQGK